MISNLVIAAIQKREAIKAEINPTKMKGSKTNLIKVSNLSESIVSGSVK
ncbi:hypothetical protein M132_1695 [Bacteroides fragilis str. S24L15]|nr:hypothetical protein M139_1829 [Bacteroides fragilis str. S23L24]EYA71612.1 hypothetical protein M132_1695 [Bacteroides fragilis str. S24L15]EYE45848.1 hypothetical protein M138_1786 [Bacteroides fragilis str. S23L17]